MSAFMTSDGTEIGKFNYPSLGLVNSFAFKFEDFKGRKHRLNCGKFSSLSEETPCSNQKLQFFYLPLFWIYLNFGQLFLSVDYDHAISYFSLVL